MHLLQRGVDLRTTPVEFAPSVQHCNGGVLIDEAAATDLPGLFAAGEVAGGQHGADRPGGNALADTQAFGHIAGESAAAWAASAAARPVEAFDAPEAEPGSGSPGAGEALGRLRALLWRSCTIVREEPVLAEALAEVESMAATGCGGNLAERMKWRDGLLCARAHLLSARARTESRGTHFRADHPMTRDPEWIALQTVRLTGSSCLTLERMSPEIDAAAREAWERSPERRSEPILPCW